MNELWERKNEHTNTCQTQGHRITFSNKKWSRHTIISQMYRGGWYTYSERGKRNTGETLRDYYLLGSVWGLYMD